MPVLAALLLAVPLAASAAEAPRPLRLDDLFALEEVSDPRISPDGAQVAFSVTRLDAKEDAVDTDLYMAPMAGGEAIRLTSGKKPESHGRFSPDGRYLAFIAEREGKKPQVFLMDRMGGEPLRLTDYKGGVSELAWAPDASRLAVVVSDPDPDAAASAGEGDASEEKDDKDKRPKPVVIRRLQFKRDGEGYLRDARRHIHVFDVRQKTSRQLSSGPFDDAEPVWSPDAQWIAFSSNRSWPDADASDDTDVFVAPAAGGLPRRLSTGKGPDSSPAFSPDGKRIAFVAGGDPTDMWYATTHVAVVPLAGGEPQPLTRALDRNVLAPCFSRDGRFVLFIVEDGGNKHLARVPVGGGAVERLLSGERDVKAFDLGPRGELAVLESQPHQPAEVSALDPRGGLRRVSRVNDEVLKGIRLGKVERFQAKSADGTPIDVFLTLPPDAVAGVKLPTLLRIHGGPVDQFSTEFEAEWQMLAAHGYAVVAANPRGSSGRGRDFARAIWADWGNKDFEDVMAAVDAAIARGVADPDRLGVGGWSYGGILTDYVITKTSRFKAAVSGASEANHLAGYGTDHYQREWERELGLPWRNRDLWLRLSPWFDVEKVTTPTLVLCGADDMNVPLLNSEQLYQALRRVGVETELVIYPGENHGIERPSFQKDRLARYLAWYDRFLRPREASLATAEAISLLGTPLAQRPAPPESTAPLEADLAKAGAEVLKDPGRPESWIDLGRRTAALGRYREAVEVYTRAIALHPKDARLYRHRGHRLITLRQFDKALADLTLAAEMSSGQPDQPEADGRGSTQYSIWYHLGLVRYLRGELADAERAYRECLARAGDDADGQVSATDWLYLTLSRQGRTADATALLASIKSDLAVGDNRTYFDRLRLYKGELKPEDLLAAGGDEITRVTYLYGLGAWWLARGDAERSREMFQAVLETGRWDAFGYIAAEADLARAR